MKKEDSKEIATIENNPVAIVQETSVMDKLLSAVVNNNMSVETLEKFMDLAERNQKREAENAFHKAFAEFKANPPKIVKDKLVNYTSSKGTTKYKHATIGAVVGAIIEGMSKVGLSHSWPLKQDGEKITVTCRISHFLGHSEETSLTACVDMTGNKNSIQGIGSTVTYLERYTIQAATGIAVLEPDDDGIKHQPAKKPVVDAAYWQDKLDRECKKENSAIVNFRNKYKKQIDAMPDTQDVTDTHRYIDDMLKEYPAPPEYSDFLKKIISGCKAYKEIDVFTADWDEKIKQHLPGLSPEEQKIAEQNRLLTVTRLTGDKK